MRVHESPGNGLDEQVQPLARHRRYQQHVAATASDIR